MKIIVAKNIGFCSGVKRAISIAEKALKKDRPVQLLGSLVHNEKVVDQLLAKGLIFCKTPEEIVPGTLIIQAHGFPPLAKQVKKMVRLEDATCPLVRRLQKLAISLQQQGYRIIIIGDKNHSEVKGIKGHLAKKNGVIIVKNKNSRAKIPLSDRVAVVAQTTQELKKVKETLKKLREKNHQIKYFNTLCPEVQLRQEQTKIIAKKAQAILVIGSKISANTGRLYQIARESGRPVFWVNSLKELKKEKLNGIETLGLVSGTSADNKEIDRIIKWLKIR